MKPAQVVVTLNNEDVKQKLAEIKEDMKAVKALRDKAFEENNTKAFTVYDRELKGLTAEARNAQKSILDVSSVLKNMSGASVNELNAAIKKTTAEFNAMKRSDAGYDEKKSQVKTLRTEIDNLNQSNKAGESTWDKMSTGVNKYFGIIAVGAATALGAIASVYSLVRDWDEATQAEKKLQNALRGRENIMPNLIKQSKELQDTINVDDDDIKAQQAFLAAQGRSEEQIKKTILAATKLSAVTGADLPSAIKQLDASFEGQVRGLGKLDAGIKSLTKEQLANGGAIDIINAKYQGFAETAAQEGLGPIKQMGFVWKDIKENMGGFFAGILLPMAKGFKGLADGVRDATTPVKSLNDQFKDQVGKVSDLKTNVEPLLNRYDELKKKANLSKLEHAELGKIIKNVSDAIPGAATQFDKYGNAIAISTGRAREFMTSQIAMMGILNKKAIEETKEQLEDLQLQLKGTTLRMDQMRKTGTFQVNAVRTGGNGRQEGYYRSATEEEKIAMKAQFVQQLAGQANLKSAIAGLNGFTLKKEMENQALASKNFEKNEKLKVVYAKKSNAELQTLANKDDELAAKMLESRIPGNGGGTGTNDANKSKNTPADIARANRSKILQDDFDNERITEEQFHEASLKSDIQYYKAKLSSTQTEAKEKTNLLKELHKQESDLNKLHYDSELKIADEASTKEKNGLIKQHIEGTINDATFHALTLQADLDFLTKKLALQLKNGQSSVDTQKEIDKQVLDAEKEANDFLLKAKDELNKAGIDNIQNEIDREIAIKEAAWVKELAALQDQLAIKTTYTEKELELNKLLTETIATKTEGHNKEMSGLNDAKALESFDIAELKATTDEQSWDAQAAKAKKVHEQELKQAGTDEKKQLLAEKKYKDSSIGIQVEKLDKEKDLGNQKFDILNNGLAVLVDIFGKETALGKAAFYAQQAAAIGQIIFNTAIGNSKIFALYPGPIGWVMAGIQTAAAAVSIASVLAQTFGKDKGKKAGGYADEDSSDDTVAGIYHANEFISNANAVRNPTIKPVLDIIDFAQRSGTIRQINLPAVIAASYVNNSQGKKIGGFASATSPIIAPSLQTPSTDTEMKAVLTNVTIAMTELKKQLQQPITAQVALLGRKGLIEKQAELDRIKKYSNF